MTRTSLTRSTGVVMALLLCALWSPSVAGAATGFVPATDFDAVTNGDLSQNPITAAAPDGTAFAAWVKPGTPARALVAVRPPGGAWSTEDLGPATAAVGGMPVAVAADGTATALSIDATGKVVRAFTRPPGGQFGNPRPLNTGDRPVSGLALAVNRGGEAVAAWYENTSGSNWQPWATFRDAGGWLQSKQISGDPGIQSLPTVAINDAGRSAVAFTTTEGSAPMLIRARAAIRPIGGAFPSESARLNTDANTHSVSPSAAVSPSGNVIVGYVAGPVGSANATAYWRIAPSAGTTFDSPQALSASGTNATQLTVVAGAGNELHAAWVQTPSLRIEYGLGAVGSPAVARTLVSPKDEKSILPRLSIDAAGNRLLLWTNTSSFLVQSAYRPAGLPDFGPVQTVIASAGSASWTRVWAAPDGQGNSVVAWAKPDGKGSTIAQAAGYDVAPPTLSGLTVPGTIPAGVPGTFGVTASDVWSTPSVQWAFGDGGVANGPSVTRAYGGPGAFTASATATDTIGNTATASAPVQVGEADADGDGIPAGRDCNDGTASVKPGARDVPGNGVDEDCNGSDAAYRDLQVNVELTWTRRVGRSTTRIATLRLDGVRDGDRVTVKCTGKGCKKSANRTRTLKKVKKGKVSLTGAVAGLQLQPKAKLSVTVARAEFVSRTFTYEIRRGKSPKKTTRCQAPGEKKSRAC